MIHGQDAVCTQSKCGGPGITHTYLTELPLPFTQAFLSVFLSFLILQFLPRLIQVYSLKHYLHPNYSLMNCPGQTSTLNSRHQTSPSNYKYLIQLVQFQAISSKPGYFLIVSSANNTTVPPKFSCWNFKRLSCYPHSPSPATSSASPSLISFLNISYIDQYLNSPLTLASYKLPSSLESCKT